MSQWDKLLARICALSKDLRFDELRKVLESYGYQMTAPPEREQPLYLPQSGLYAHYDTQARTDQESICGNGVSDRRE